MSEGVQYAGEFKLEDMILTSPSGVKTDLLTDFGLVELNLYEDIFRSSISGSLMVADYKNVFTKLPLMGQEKLSLKVSTPSLEEKEDIIDFSEHHFSVYRLNNNLEVSSGARMYEIYFISEEELKNTRKRVSKSYVNTKANIGEIVTDLLTQDLMGVQTNKEIDVESTVGSRSLVAGNSHPYTFITRLSKEAVSAETGSPHYVFFENKNGIHFKTLQKLYEKEPRAEFHGGERGHDEEYEGNGDAGKIPQMYKRMIQYNINTKKDLLINSSAGMLGGKVIEHNIFNKRFNVKTFNYLGEEDYHCQ